VTAKPTNAGAFLLTDRVAVVTAGCGGLGAQIARTLLGLGARVVATSREEATAARFEASCDGQISGRRLVFNAEAVNRFMHDVAGEFGRLDVLVNTVGGNAASLPVEAVGIDDLMTQFHDGCATAFMCAQAVVRLHAKNHIRSIVNIGSVYGSLAPDPRIYRDDHDRLSPVTYACAKGALVQMTRYLASYWAPLGVRVNCVSAGGVRRAQPERFLARYANRVPMARMADAQEIATAVAFLASDASSYITGVDLPVDGGLQAW
jgi:NAD(P)-dependent dehydrogenase (short-subunit alcohol dehydrogenase family)